MPSGDALFEKLVGMAEEIKELPTLDTEEDIRAADLADLVRSHINVNRKLRYLDELASLLAVDREEAREVKS